MAKRLFDLSFAAAALIVTLPILIPACFLHASSFGCRTAIGRSMPVSASAVTVATSEW